ncbi:SDR family NAD(P)-dependent oxidoreductase [Hoeflea prorocentri]|uniref:SDR family oxidoreductase n=1 Tax=Hoeflea prorocentri TaxID=1922333 RepID=A0A9X3ZGP3_9HYPH|nr:SDR family oxidoreductase [Hoeflea prorocentri]MCY6379950.1 SDR family oxidoreductase [Hoeflea prorocentri]MDA5397750.1 SDR family oxidoreductase [Hoeflea prorocentri]
MFFQSLVDRTVIVTGAAGGIGSPLLQLCQKAGADILALDRDERKLRQAAEQLDDTTRVVYKQSDLAGFKECSEVLGLCPSNPVALVHLAGVFEPDSDDHGDYTVWDRAIDNNLKNARDMCLAFADSTSKADLSRIVLTSSLAANRGAFDHYSYTAAKAALIGLTRAFSKRFAPHTVVNCVAPGIIMTGMPDRVLANRRERVLSEIPLQRFGEPEEVANVIMFLISDAASYVSGQVINIDGGTING